MITLATISSATAQEIFDQVAAHLIRQGQPALGRLTNSAMSASCMYRGVDGLKCAAGCLIADEEYNPQMEGHGWIDLVYEGLVGDEHSSLVDALQGAHDKAPVQPILFLDYVKAELRKIAERRNLNTEVLDNAGA